jgi:ADP-ribose pyrophosphatase YjhB (NUDIX family)
MKQAGVMLIVKDGLILSISRRNDKTKFGLPGGKCEENEPVKDAAIRETQEETAVSVKDCTWIFTREEPRHAPEGQDFECHCFYATQWDGEPHNSEEGDVKWLTVEELTTTNGAFPDYNRKTINAFKTIFPSVYLKGE